MHRSLAVFFALTFSLAAMADEAVFLSKDQIGEVLGGKAFTYVRPRDKNVVRWDFKADGAVYANNRSNTRPGSAAAGNWTVQDDGTVCVKWRDGTRDSCDSYFLEGSYLKRAAGRSAQDVVKAVTMTPD